MKNIASITRVGLAALAFASAPMALAGTAAAQSTQVEPTETLTLSQGSGRLVRLPGTIDDIFLSNPGIADVQIRSNRELYLFGLGAGTTDIYATNARDEVVWAAKVQVGTNFGSVGELLRLAMPESDIRATTMNDLVLLTGTVASPEDAIEAERLVSAYTGGGQVVSRLRAATPQQVNLRVRIAEVNRSALKSIGVNLLGDNFGAGGFEFGISQGTAIDDDGTVFRNPVGTTLAAAGELFGLDITGALDLAETDGLATTLAEPNLTALSGETASFLAGGEFPIPVSQAIGAVSIEYRSYGVQLSFTPIVLADGRISMRVAPEVSELSNDGAISLNGYTVPSITTRRAETTVELGSGQSFMIGGLLRQNAQNTINKTPFLGDLPILGALFRSTSFRKNETELVIIVTPYLVNPVSGQLPTPVDGYRHPNVFEHQLEGKTYTGVSGPAGVTPTARIGNAPRPAASVPVQPGFSL
ncbi:type II and III secretion system protein family protein [Sphingomicrobium sp. XHP0239]|uniref:type II and III secretion system protein family protein n=1 Tax=Sphingomicrobium maritimum TaxID=3133972 RepID=UPI0031CC5EF9